MLYGTLFHNFLAAGRVLAETRNAQAAHTRQVNWVAPELGYLASNLDSFVDATPKAESLLSHMGMIQNGVPSCLSLLSSITLVAILGAAFKFGTGLMVIRPHDDKIRKPVFEVLSKLGVNTDDAEILKSGTSNEEALAKIKRHRPVALLIPFHPERTSSGIIVDGLSLARRVDDNLEELRNVKIYMPANAWGRSSIELALALDPDSANGVSARLRKRLYIINIEKLDDPELYKRISPLK
jgi:hypothetical protein